MKKKKKSFPKKPALVLTAAALLLVGSTVGSTRAALTYYSENYSAQMNMQSIGVSLLENDKVVSSRDYVSNNEWKGTSDGTLLTNLLGKDETFTPGKKYNEAISVKNSGTIDTFAAPLSTPMKSAAETEETEPLLPPSKVTKRPIISAMGTAACPPSQETATSSDWAIFLPI